MTARPQVELPELPEPINGGSRGFGQLWNPLYSEDQMRAYARQVIAESEARAEGLVAAVRKMHEADAAYGCGFYDDGNWLEAYELTLQLVGIDTAIQAQEAEREAGSA